MTHCKATRLHSAEPAGLAAALGRPGPGDVAWPADDLGAETERLAARGLDGPAAA
jgi:hypothetical protein